MSKTFYLLTILLIIAAGFGIYSNSLNGDFVMDDLLFIENNANIRSFSHIPQIFATYVGSDADRTGRFYRPLHIISYVFDYRFWKLNPRGYHLTNVGLHVFTALCVYWLIMLLCSNKWLSLLTGIIFLIHPINHEPVCFISARPDIMAALFSLVGFIFYIKYSQSQLQDIAGKVGRYLIIVLSYALAFLSKENSLVLPLLLLLYSCAFKVRPKKVVIFSLIFLAAGYIISRLTILPQGAIQLNYLAGALPRLPGIFVAITNYLILLIIPFWLHAAYLPKNFLFTDPKVILGFILVLTILTLAIRAKSKHPIVFFSVGWFFLWLLPALNIYPLSSYMAERYLYLSSIGFSLLLAKSLLFLINKAKTIASIFTLLLLIFYAGLTIKQTNYWKNWITVLKRTTQIEPYNYQAYEVLGLQYFLAGQAEKGIENELKALTINKHHKEAYSNLGKMYHELGRGQEEINLYLAAINLNPDYFMGYYRLGNIYMQRGDYAKAEDFYKKAVEVKPDYAEAYNNLAVLYYLSKQYAPAIEYCRKAQEYGYTVNREFLEALEPYQAN